MILVWQAMMAAAREHAAAGRRQERWMSLERAHIASQPLAWPHLRTHATMLGAAIADGDWREALGQIPRILLALPATWTRRYPLGNTGRANVSMFAAMPLPPELTSPPAPDSPLPPS